MKKRSKEVRTYERYDKKAKAFIFFNYNFTTKMDFVDFDAGGAPLAGKYPACSKNVSAEGLCFTSLKQLKRGDNIQLELYLGEENVPLHMRGEVRWSQSSIPGEEEQENSLFDTGVRLLFIEGKSVPESIHYDNRYHVIWSEALEHILGKYKAKRDKNKQDKE